MVGTRVIFQHFRSLINLNTNIKIVLSCTGSQEPVTSATELSILLNLLSMISLTNLMLSAHTAISLFVVFLSSSSFRIDWFSHFLACFIARSHMFVQYKIGSNFQVWGRKKYINGQRDGGIESNTWQQIWDDKTMLRRMMPHWCTVPGPWYLTQLSVPTWNLNCYARYVNSEYISCAVKLDIF